MSEILLPYAQDRSQEGFWLTNRFSFLDGTVCVIDTHTVAPDAIEAELTLFESDMSVQKLCSNTLTEIQSPEPTERGTGFALVWDAAHELQARSGEPVHQILDRYGC